MARPAKASKSQGETAPKKRGRKPAAPKPTKEETVESGAVLPIEELQFEDKDYLMHSNAILAAKGRLETAKSALNLAKKNCKSADPDLYATIMEEISMNGKDQNYITQRIRHIHAALKHMGAQVQFTMFNGLLGETLDAIHSRGYEDGKAGKSPDITYAKGSEEYNSYLDGWNEGTAFNAAKLGEKPVEKSSSPSPNPEKWNQNTTNVVKMGPSPRHSTIMSEDIGERIGDTLEQAVEF